MEKLICAVSEYPELYNKTLPAYRDPVKRAEAWKAVSERAELKEEICRKKWKNLRDVYTRHSRADRNGNGNALRKWKFSRHLSFLLPFQQPRSRSGTTSAEEEIEDENEEEAETISNSEVVVDLDESVNGDKMSPKHNGVETQWKDSLQTDGDNEDEMFFLSLLPHLKRLPYKKKCAIKLKFHQLLHEAEFE